MFEDPRLNRKKVRVPRRDNYEKRPVLSATIHPDIKKTLVSMSERTGRVLVRSQMKYYTLAWLRCRSSEWGRGKHTGPPIDT